MKLVGFMCITNPIKGAYPYLEAIRSHLIFLDKLIIIDGGSTDGALDELDEVRREYGDRLEIQTLLWPQGKGNWTWEEFSDHWNFGLSLCKVYKADWFCAAECDHVWHEKDALQVRDKIIEKGNNQMCLFADKLVSSTWDVWESKSKFAYFLNIGQFPMIKYGLDRNWKGGQDLANPIICTTSKGGHGIPEGVMIDSGHGKNLGLYFWNYDKTFKTAEQIVTERESANWAWNNGCLVKMGLMPKWKDEGILEDVISRMKARYEKKIRTYSNISDHPQVMHERLSRLSSNLLGYNLFGNTDD